MDRIPYRWRQRSAPQPWVQRSCASPAGRRMGPGPKRGRAETKERRGDKEKEERDSAAPNVIMQWTGSANGGGARCFVFLFFIFSRWGDAAACVARAQLRGGAPVQGNLWKAHTHRSGQGGCMLENSGLVLGVDSSLGLLTRLHNPRHIGVALLVHGRLLHLIQKEMVKKEDFFFFVDWHIFSDESTSQYCIDLIHKDTYFQTQIIPHDTYWIQMTVSVRNRHFAWL